MKMSKEYSEVCFKMSSEQRYRLVVLGSAKTGKTALIRRYLYNDFSEKYKETIEDLHSREFRIGGRPLPLDILDTNFNFPDMRRIAITSANAFLLVFAVDNVQSFKEMSDLWEEICQRRTDIKTLPVVVAGNKSDLLSKKIFRDTAEAWVSRLKGNVRYVEVSARTSASIPEIFRNLLDLSEFLHPKAVLTTDDEDNESNKGSDKSDSNNSSPRNPQCHNQQELTAGSKLRRHRSMRANFSPRFIRRLSMSKSDAATEGQAKRDAIRGHNTVDHTNSNSSLLLTPYGHNSPPAFAIRRNKSLKVRGVRDRVGGAEKETVVRTNSGGSAEVGHNSLIQRTKHMSLKMKRHGDKQQKNREQDKDESDCKIS